MLPEIIYGVHHCPTKITQFSSLQYKEWQLDNITIAWNSLLSEWYTRNDKHHKSAQDLINQTPIPSHLRTEAWFIFSGAAELMSNSSNQTYEELYSMPCKFADIIEKDIRRTYGTHVNFTRGKCHTFRKSQHCLKRILLAYANRDILLGYCQGMNYIAAFLIEIYGGLNEEQAFWTFVAILNQIRSLFISGLPGFIKLSDNFKQLCKHHLPELFEAWSILPESDAIWNTILTTWFHTLFVYPRLDHTYVAYIWDLFFINDFSVFMTLAITIIAHNEKKLAQMNFMELNNFIKYLPNMKKNANRLIHASLTLSLHSKYINPCRDLTQFDWHGNGEKKMRKMYKKHKEKQRVREMGKDNKYCKSPKSYNLDQNQNENMRIIDIDDNSEMVSDSSTVFSNACIKDSPMIHTILSTLESGELYSMNDSSADGNYSYYSSSNRNNCKMRERNKNSASNSSIESPRSLKNLEYEYKVIDAEYVDDDDEVCATPSLKNLEYTQVIITDDEEDKSYTKSLTPKIYHEMSTPIHAISLITPRISNATNIESDGSGGKKSLGKKFIPPFLQ